MSSKAVTKDPRKKPVSKLSWEDLDFLEGVTEKVEKRKVGFALLPKEVVKERAKIGSQKAQESGKAHRYTSGEAQKWGAKGGRAMKGKPVGFSLLPPEERKRLAKKGSDAAARNGNRHKLEPKEVLRGAKLGGATVAARPGHMDALRELAKAAILRKKQEKEKQQT